MIDPATSMTPNKTPSIQPAHKGIPVGIVSIVVTQVQTFRNLLDKTLGERTRFRGVEKNASSNEDENLRTIHLPPNVCAALDDRNCILVSFLESVGGVYTAGVRMSKKIWNNDTRVNKKRKMEKRVTPQHASGAAPSFTFVELFAGIGGFRLALEKIGGACVFASEMNTHSAAIYKRNFECDALEVGDILDVESATLGTFSMLTAGFPCQPFTFRGERRGLDDDRGQLYRECARILHDQQPASFLFENVVGLVPMDGGSRPSREKNTPDFVAGRVFQHILKAFTACGYTVQWRVINSRLFVPQNRERVYIVGLRHDLGCDRINWDNVLAEAGDAVDSTVRSIMETKDSTWCMRSELKPSQWAKVQAMHVKRGRNPYEESRINLDGKAPTIISNYHRVGSLSTRFVHEQSDGTLCNGEAPNRRPRFLTPRECASIMGFPESYCVPSWSDSQDDVAHFYQGIGNAVTPPAVSAIGKEILRCINNATAAT